MRRRKRAPQSPETDATGTARAVGFFARLGAVVVRWPWLVIGCWIALAAALTSAVPSLMEVTQKNPVSTLPVNAPAMLANRQMAEAFPESGTENVLLVLLTNDNGLGQADEHVYKTLVDRLHRDVHDVVMVQDFLATPQMRSTLSSQDGKAWILPIGIAGELGSPESNEAYARVVDIIDHAVADSALKANLTGPAATVADAFAVGLRDQARIESAIITFLLVILLIIYRNPITMLLPLLTIGVSLGVAQATVAGVATQWGMPVASQTIVLLTGMIAGAGTDYAVFLISRYHDYLRHGANSDQAVERALSSVGKVIAASAGQVGITFLGMSFTRLELFATTGPALAIGIAVAFLAAITLLPAMMVLVGRRGWVKPRRELTTRFWRRSGIRTVRRPKSSLVSSLIVLLILAGCVAVVRYNYDDRKELPDTVESSVGYAAVDRYFPMTSIIPQYLFIQSPHDLRTPEVLADLEQMARRVSQLPGVASVRGITRPDGVPLEAASTTYQAGEVGKKLNDASTLITDRTADLDKLASGARQLADGLVLARDQMTQAMSGIGSLMGTLTSLQNQFGGNAMLGQLGQANQLMSGMRALGDTLQNSFGTLTYNFEWIDPVLIALDGSPYCNTNLICSVARGQFHQLRLARDNGVLEQFAGLARQLQSTGPLSQLSQTLTGLSESMNSLTAALKPLGLGGAGGGRQSPLGNLGDMKKGFDALADGSRQVADGVQELVGETKRMGANLGDASEFLLTMRNDAAKPSMAGFYIPPQLLDSDDFRKAAGFFISRDGHAARYLVQTEFNPFSTAAMDQVNAIEDTARGAQPNTALADASASMTGYSASLRDGRDYYEYDIRFIIVFTTIVVLLILILLLRAIVAPLYLIASVILSYLSALGIGVIVFQFLLGKEMHWSVPGFAFIILVAMGTDYNMLLISRIRDESPRGIRSGVIRTVGTTGGVITAAGLIFAASMYGLLFASIGTIVQAGFVVGTGILLDTFLVRTVTVPAMAVLVGRANWWPARWAPRSSPPTGRGGQLPAPGTSTG
jgi:putative drug exporter of the RND superfamily